MRRILLLLSFFSFIYAAPSQPTTEVYASFDVVAKERSKLSILGVGTVEKINVEVGDIVKKGDVLLALDSSAQQIALQNANNSLKKATLAKEHLKKSFDRYKSVKNTISKQSFEDIEFEFKKISLEEENAKIGVENAQDRLNKTLLKAPYDGVIVFKFIEVGEGVAAPSQPLIEMMSYPMTKLLLSFDSKFIDVVKVGQEFRYRLEGGDKEFSSTIDLIYPTIDIRNRKVYAISYVKELKVGLFGEGKIIIK